MVLASASAACHGAHAGPQYSAAAVSGCREENDRPTAKVAGIILDPPPHSRNDLLTISDAHICHSPGPGLVEVPGRWVMAIRGLIGCLLAVMLIQPTAAGTSVSNVAQTGIHEHPPGAMSGDNHPLLSYSAIGPTLAHLASLHNATGTLSPCSQKLALGPDLRCVSACDASKESCDRQCSSVRATCLAQCLGLGFACDYYCHAASFVCKANCGRAHDACVSNCPTRGAEKES